MDESPTPTVCIECGNDECMEGLSLCTDCLMADRHIPVLRERCRRHRD